MYKPRILSKDRLLVFSDRRSGIIAAEFFDGKTVRNGDSHLGEAHLKAVHVGNSIPPLPTGPIANMFVVLEQMSQDRDDWADFPEIMSSIANVGAQAILEAIRSGKLTFEQIMASKPDDRYKK